MKVLVTGGAGFIGSHFIRSWMARQPADEVINLDVLTYAGSRERLRNVESARGYRFVQGDVCDPSVVRMAMRNAQIVVHFAAQTHVDRSILHVSPFLQTNVVGVQVLLEAARDSPVERFVHVSCYDRDTRALTRDGLKHYWEIRPGDQVISLNRHTGAIEEKEVEAVIVQDYRGEMVHFKSNRIDLMVTPNHPMFFSTARRPGAVRVEAADTLRHRASVYIPRGKWKGVDKPTLVIPGLGAFATADVFYVAGVFIGDGFLATQRQRRPNKTGLSRVQYLKTARDRQGRFSSPGKVGDAECSTLTCHRIFFDVPRRDKARSRLEHALSNLRIAWTAHDGQAGQHLYFSSALWSRFFEQFGVGFANKHIPTWMLEYDVQYLRRLFDGLMDSDGYYRDGGIPCCFSTSSARLVANVCEMSFKLGLFPRFSARNGAATLKSGRTIRPSTQAYLIYFRRGKIGIDKDIARLKPYAGTVWCLKVREHKNFVVERRGTMTFCGNTDEVYGPVLEGAVDEQAPFSPRSPYAASKAAGDLLVQAFHETYQLPTIVVRPTNIFGPAQLPEKFIPLTITNAVERLPVPIYGDGQQRRSWLFVDDLCDALRLVVERGHVGQSYNVGSGHEQTNLTTAKMILSLLGCSSGLIRFVADRPGHDRRYALDDAKLCALGWMPRVPFEQGLAQTVRWYRQHQTWWRPLVERLREDPAHWLNRPAGERPERVALARP